MDLNFVNSFFAPNLWIKILTLVAIAFYAIFAFVVFTQIRLMERIISLPHASALFKTISIINIILSVSLFIIAIVIL